MSRTPPYTIGRADSSIHDFVTSLDAVPSGLKYALIACLDSSTDPADLLSVSPLLRPLKPHCRSLGHGLVVTTRQLVHDEGKTRMFYGFDEVWFFAKRPTAPKPSGLAIAGRESVKPDSLPEDGLRWLAASGCTLGLGDGLGLNYLARVQGVGRNLLGMYADLRFAGVA